MTLVKTTLELPADLVRELKLRAAIEDRRLKDVVAEALRRGLAPPPGRPTAGRVRFPLVLTAHPAEPHTEMTPDRVAEILAEGESAR